MDNFDNKDPYNNYNVNPEDNYDRGEKNNKNSEDNPFVSGSGAYETNQTYSQGDAPYSSNKNPYSGDAPYAEENPYGKGTSYDSSVNPYSEGPSSSGNATPSSFDCSKTTSVFGTPIKEEKSAKGVSIASLVLGIVSITLCCCSIVGIICAVLGLVFGIIAQKRQPSGMGLAGIITSAFGIALGVLGFFLNSLMFEDLIDEIMREFENSIGSSFDDSSFDNNNNAFINILKFIKSLLIG